MAAVKRMRCSPRCNDSTRAWPDSQHQHQWRPTRASGWCSLLIVIIGRSPLLGARWRVLDALTHRCQPSLRLTHLVSLTVSFTSVSNTASHSPYVTRRVSFSVSRSPLCDSLSHTLLIRLTSIRTFPASFLLCFSPFGHYFF